MIRTQKPAFGNRPTTSDDFDPVWYLQTYEDVRASGMDPWDHYQRTGRAEGRQGGPVRALELDLMLWRGYADIALPALQDLLRHGDAREQAVAGWALARWEAEHRRWSKARQAILVFHQHPEGAQVLRHPGPWLVGVQMCLACHDTKGAQRILKAGINHFGHLPDFELAGMLVERVRPGDDWELSPYLGRIYYPHGLAPVRIEDGPGHRFDRLQADTLPFHEGTLANQPLVSVIVPVFNGAKGLPTALRGLCAQSWRNLEILVVDDGSSDDSLIIAEAASKKDSRIRVLQHTANQGAYPARNTGFAAARGDFITVHDADDWSHPQKIEAQAITLLRQPELQATVSHWVRASNDLEMTRWRTEEAWVYRNVSSLMLRAELRDILGYWDRVRVNADTEYYYRLIRAFGESAIREVCPGVPLSFGRTEPESLTMQSGTHLRTQFVGLRRDYMDRAHHWHHMAATPDDLYMAQHPEYRLFRVPPSIGLGDPEGPPSEFDIVAASPLFDLAWYRLCHPDVLRADLSPVRHYLSGGARENRDPGPFFSTGGYRQAQKLGPNQNPLVHFETKGRDQGAVALPVFAGQLTPPTDALQTLIFAHTSGKTLFGAERSLLGVVERMARHGQNPVVVLPTLRNMDYLEQLLKTAVAVEVVPQLWYHASRPPPKETVNACRSLIRKYKVREIHVNTMVLDAPLLAARAEGCRSTVYVRELPDQDVALRRILGADAESLRRWLLSHADRFVVTAQPVADWLSCPERTVIRPNSVDEALFEEPFNPSENLKVALISSNIAKKGLADFLSVARIVAKENRPIRFLLIGPPTHDLHLMQPLPPNVDFRGYAQTPLAALRQADLVMSLSKFAESFGRTIMEAMAAGRPVICYDRGTPPSLVESGINGFVVPADDPQCAANAVLALDAARGQLGTMSAAARGRARELQRLAQQD